MASTGRLHARPGQAARWSSHLEAHGALGQRLFIHSTRLLQSLEQAQSFRNGPLLKSLTAPAPLPWLPDAALCVG
jgi:hypothetical protein